jgi:adenosine deaminase
MNLRTFISRLPKAELHVHLEGTLEPELLLTLAERNKVKLPYSTVKEIAAIRANAKKYDDFLQAFIVSTQVLMREQDFYDVAYAYFRTVAKQGVKHAEVTFDTQTYAPRDIKAGAIICALHAATVDALKEFGITSFLILCFLRHLSQEDAFKSLQDSLPYKDKIIGVGLASTESGNPPIKFKDVFAQARRYGFRTTAHAGENQGPQYIWQAINDLHVDRIDHGVRSIEDPTLMDYLRKTQLPLTVCPLSNVALAVVPTLHFHPFKKMLQAGLLVSLHSDDPAYFGGYIADVYEKVAIALQFSKFDLAQIARNSFASSFLDESLKQRYYKDIETFVLSAV